VSGTAGEVIDCHCHAGEGEGFTGPWDTRAPLDRYLERAGRAGIARTVLFAAFHGDYAAANRRIAEIVRRAPDRFLGFAFVHAARDRGRIGAMVEEAVTRLGLAGIKVHRHDARLSREVCETARGWRLPVLYDPMGEMAAVELAAAEFPEVAFIIPHLGSFADDWRAQRECIDILARRPNVFTDTSGIRRFDLLEEALARAGAGKVLFGSDGPWLHPGVELAKVLALPLTPGERRLVLGGNLRRLLRRAVGCPVAISRRRFSGDPGRRCSDVRPRAASAAPCR